MRQHPAPVRAFELVITKLHGGGSTRRITASSPDTEDDDVDVTCVSFAPGHNVHPIQANRGLRTPSDAYTIVAVEPDHVVVRDVDGTTETWWMHDTTAAAAALLLEEEPAIHRHAYRLARIGDTLLSPSFDGPAEPCLRPTPAEPVSEEPSAPTAPVESAKAPADETARKRPGIDLRRAARLPDEEGSK